MPSRTYWIPALILWFVSTGWLVSSKILPALDAGSPPDYEELLPATAVNDPEPVKWSIRWKGKNIGWAENRISRSFDGTGRIVSEVQFEQLPVDEMIRDVMGVLGRFTNNLTGELGVIDLRVFTNLDFDNYGEFSNFETRVDVGSMASLLKIEGRVLGGQTGSCRPHPRRRQRTERSVSEPRDRTSSQRLVRRYVLAATTAFQPPCWSDMDVPVVSATNAAQPAHAHRGTCGTGGVDGMAGQDGSRFSRCVSKGLWQRNQFHAKTRQRIVGNAGRNRYYRQDLWLANVKVQFLRAAEADDAGDRSLPDVSMEAPDDRTVVEEAGGGMIEIENLTRNYGSHTAVDQLTLKVRPSEVLAFLGPNGAGKTTTIKTIVGLLLPSSGSVRVCGVDVVTDPREASRRIGYVPDQPYLYEKLSGREFLQFTAEMYGLKASDTDAKHPTKH